MANPTDAVIQIAQDVNGMAGGGTDVPRNPTDAVIQAADDIHAMAESGSAFIPKTSIHLAYINAIMEQVVLRLMNAEDANIIVALDTTSDNTLHTRLTQCRQKYKNSLTDVKVGDTDRHMIFQYDNSEMFSCDGFYIDEVVPLFATFKMVVKWNQIGVFATKYTMTV